LEKELALKKNVKRLRASRATEPAMARPVCVVAARGTHFFNLELFRSRGIRLFN